MSKEVLTRTSNLVEKDWLTFRKQGIGGSDAAVACGLSKWKSPLELWLEKTGQKEPESAGEKAYWGTVMEPVIREEFARRSGLPVTPVPYMFRCKEHPFMLANIDGVIKYDKINALFEAKTANAFVASEWENGLPQEYYIQIQHYMAVCDLPKAYIAVLIGGNTFKYHEIARDDEAIENIIRLEEEFWQKVVSKTKPEVSAQDSELINRLYPNSTPASLILGKEADELVQKYLLSKQAEDATKADKALCENKLKELLGENEDGKTPSGYCVTWKTSKTTRLDSTNLKVELPEVFQKYASVSSCRKFSITEGKK